MVTRLFLACGLMALCVTIHAAGVTGALSRLRRTAASARTFWSSLRLFILLAVWMVLLHLAEIGVWAIAFVRNGALADMPTALYFSAVTYTTTGYGDVTLPIGWRLDGGVEALTGILMCGWSTGFFFAIVNRLFDARAAAPSC
jgi:Ion channel